MWCGYATVLVCWVAVVVGKIDVLKEQNQFNEHPNDIAFLSLFYGKHTFKQHTPALFKGMERRGLAKFLSKRRQFVPLLTAKDTTAMSEKDPRMCRLLAPSAMEMTREASSGMSYECFLAILKSLRFPVHQWADAARIKLLQDRIVKTGGVELLYRLRAVLHHLSEGQLRAMMSEKNAAASINIAWLRKLTIKQLAVFSAEQYALMVGWNDPQLDTSLITRLPDYTFSKIDFYLRAFVFPGMTKAQVENFGYCQHMRPDLLSRKTLPGLKSRCFKTYIVSLENNPSRIRELGKMIVFADEHLLDKLDEEDTKMIHANDWTNFSGEQLQHLPATSCAGISKSARPADNMHFIPTPVCFAKLHPRHQLAFLKRRLYELPTSTLSQMDRSAVEEWPDRMNTLAKFRLPGSMIQQLGAEIEKKEEHPCSLFTCVGCLKKAPLVMSNMGASCSKAVATHLPENTEPALYRAMLSGVHIAPSSLRPEILRNMHQVTLGLIVKDVEFCSHLTFAEFGALGRVVSTLSSECIKEFRFLGQLKRDDIQSLNDKAFSSFDVAKFALISDLLSLTPAQFSHLGSQPPEDAGEKHPINAFSLEKIPVIPIEYIAQFSERHLGNMRPSLVAALTAVQVQSLPAKAFRRLPVEQFNALSVEACTIEQLENLGADLPEATVYRLSAEQVTRLGGNAKMLLMKNSRLTSGAQNLVPGWTIALAFVSLAGLMI